MDTIFPERAPKALVVATQPRPYAPRIFQSLAEAGFEVGAVHTPGHILQAVVGRSFGRAVPPWGLTAGLRRAIDAWTPDLIAPCDERSVAALHRIHQGAPRTIAALIERSLGDPAHFAETPSKGDLVRAAQTLGLPVPETMVVIDRDRYAAYGRNAAAGLSFPHVLKGHRGWGGNRVVVVEKVGDLEAAWRGVSAPPSLINALKMAVREGGIDPFLECRDWRPAPIMLQHFVAGRPANRAVVCWQGEVLAGLSVVAIETLCANGPAAVVEVIDHDDMARSAAAMVRHWGLSGFCGFDFMLERETGRALLLELNPRVTPTAHLAVAGMPALAPALFTKLTGRRPASHRPAIRHKIIALFPGAWMHDRNSPYLTDGETFHDVPWAVPALIRRCLDELAVEDRIRAIKRWLSLAARWANGKSGSGAP